MTKNKPLLKVELLSKGDIDRIHEMSLRILDQVGVTVPHPEMLGAAAGADIFGHMGISGVDQASSLDILVMQHEVIDYVESVLRQISFSEEDFAVEEILNAGPGGNFLDSIHTAEHFRSSLWFPQLLNRDFYDAWREAGAASVFTNPLSRYILGNSRDPWYISRSEAVLMYQTGQELRQAARRGEFTAHTSGLARGFVQANLVVLPFSWAYDFLLFAQRNPKPCPVLEVGDPGDPHTRALAEHADVRTDVPLYRIYESGELVDERKEITAIWQDDFVFFLLGCSFTFEQALLDAGLTLRHREEGRNVPMYRTNIPCRGAGRFQPSPMVVSMRPYLPGDAIKAVELTREFPMVHGSPVHLGDPRRIGIEDIEKPDWGDKVSIRPGEIPVFWACGVTPQLAALVSEPPIMITHAPGHMFVGDRQDYEFKL